MNVSPKKLVALTFSHNLTMFLEFGVVVVAWK